MRMSGSENTQSAEVPKSRKKKIPKEIPIDKTQNAFSDSRNNQNYRLQANIHYMKGDTMEPGMPCCCGVNDPPPPAYKKPEKALVNIVTYKKMLAPDKMLIIKQEIEKPRVTLWVVFHAFMFLMFLGLIAIGLQSLSFRFTKVEEIMAVLILLLFILVFFRPRYFIPFYVFNLNDEVDVDDCMPD